MALHRASWIAIPAFVVALGAASAQASEDSVRLSRDAAAAMQASVWCVQGATLTVAVSIALSLPAAATGAGMPIATSQILGAAGVGCGFGVIWGVTTTGVRWMANQVDQFFRNPTPPAVLADKPLMKDEADDAIRLD